MKRLYFSVTNDLTYDQRMIRICTSLAAAGYEVELIGRKLRSSRPLTQLTFKQKRLSCVFNKGFLFYAEFNFRLFVFLLFRKKGLICAIDLDTILPCYFASVISKAPRVYDAHELFCEMQEIVSRPRIYRVWKSIEQKMVPRFQSGYTVNRPIAEEFRRMYGSDFEVIRNVPVLRPLAITIKNEKYILYQGAVNAGRAFDTLIPAMDMVNAKLVICGDGNYMKQVRALVDRHNLHNKVSFAGMVPPEELRRYTDQAWIGVTLFESSGRSNYFSLANRFFDYMHAGVPQVCVNYPVYNDLNNETPFAVLIDDLQPSTIAGALNSLIENEELYAVLQKNCLTAREKYNWDKEEQKLVRFYKKII